MWRVVGPVVGWVAGRKLGSVVAPRSAVFPSLSLDSRSTWACWNKGELFKSCGTLVCETILIGPLTRTVTSRSGPVRVISGCVTLRVVDQRHADRFFAGLTVVGVFDPDDGVFGRQRGSIELDGDRACELKDARSAGCPVGCAGGGDLHGLAWRLVLSANAGGTQRQRKSQRQQQGKMECQPSAAQTHPKTPSNRTPPALVSLLDAGGIIKARPARSIHAGNHSRPTYNDPADRAGL